MSIPKQENFKGEFQEYMNKHPEFYFKLNYQEIKSKFDQNQTIYEYELVINDVIPIKRSGEQKKTVERLVFKDAVSLLKTDSFQQLLDDSMRSQLDQSIVLEKSFQFQEKGFEQEQQHNGSQVSSNIHQLLIKNVDKLENLKSKIEFLQKNTEDEKAEISQVIEQFLMHY